MLLRCLAEMGGSCVRRPERPVHIFDDEKEHRGGANVTCAARKCEHIFGKTRDVVCLTVVCVEENLNMFPGCLYSVCMGASPSRTRLKFRAVCNRHSQHPNLNLSRVAV
jgi:hypothetical protein